MPVTQCGISDAGAVSFVGRFIQRTGNQKPIINPFSDSESVA